MDFDNVARSLPKAMIDEFERATESGVWSNGIPMTQRQIDICRQAIEIARAASGAIKYQTQSPGTQQSAEESTEESAEEVARDSAAESIRRTNFGLQKHHNMAANRLPDPRQRIPSTLTTSIH